MEEPELIKEALIYFTSQEPKFKRSFLKWSILDSNGKIILSNLVKNDLNEDNFMYYQYLIEAFKLWEHWQDTQGACGFNYCPIKFSCDENMESDLNLTISIVEKRLDRLLLNDSIKTPQKNKTPKKITNFRIIKTTKENRRLSDSNLLISKLKTNLNPSKSCTNILKTIKRRR